MKYYIIMCVVMYAMVIAINIVIARNNPPPSKMFRDKIGMPLEQWQKNKGGQHMISAKRAAIKAERCRIRREKKRAKREHHEIRERAIKKINEAIRDGSSYTSFSFSLDEPTIEYLRKRGYTVEDADGRWDNKYIVKW